MNLKYCIFLFFLFTFAISIGQNIENSVDKPLNTKNISKDLSDVILNDYNYIEYGLTIQCPYKLISNTMKFPNSIRKMDSYYYRSLKFQIFINCIKYNSIESKLNLNGAAYGSIQKILSMDGITNFHFTEDFIDNNNIPGVIQNIAFNTNEVDLEFINAVFINDLIFIQILVGYQKNDLVNKAIALKIIDSIKLKKDINSKFEDNYTEVDSCK